MDALAKVLNPSPQFPESRSVNLTVKFKSSSSLSSIRTWAQHVEADVLELDKDDEDIAVLMSRFPMQDIGISLIHGPLPLGATTYRADAIFQIDSKAPAITAQDGYGLVFKVENERVHVQYGNCVHIFGITDIAEDYDVFLTGLPFPTL